MEKTKIGVIRWDAWVGEKHPLAIAFAKNLTSPEYQYRLPFFAQNMGDGTIKVDGARQEIYDRELEFAHQGGIDYFAVCWYPDGSGLEHQRKLYFTSTKKHLVKWCIIHGTNPFDMEKDMSWLVNEMKNDTYQKVVDGRPLVYMFTVDEGQRTFVEKLRMDCKQAGLKDPYIVGMGFSKDISKESEQLGLDAISAYCCYAENGCSYERQMEGEMERWEQYRGTGMNVIPFVTTGFDNRPRFQADGVHGAGADYQSAFIEEATPEQIAQHVSNGINWCKSYPETAVANAIIMYAWNENDEGGWLIPTRDEMEQHHSSPRLDAISKVKR